VPLAPVDELGVDAERDVVQEDPVSDAADVDAPLPPGEGIQRADRIVPVEAEVPREVVARSEGDGDERELALEGDVGDGAK
jgi:hypothetical protein